ncbi:trehalose-6-phosphate synthase, partial [Vibrio parahaemolyticus]
FDAYYNGYCNGTLWPLFHYFPERFTHDQRHYEAYQAVNAQFARGLMKVINPGDAVWVHDYQLIPLGRLLRENGFEGPLGFYLHIPFPH